MIVYYLPFFSNALRVDDTHLTHRLSGCRGLLTVIKRKNLRNIMRTVFLLACLLSAANAAVCSTWTCTAVLSAGNGGGASGQTVSIRRRRYPTFFVSNLFYFSPLPIIHSVFQFYSKNPRIMPKTVGQIQTLVTVHHVLILTDYSVVLPPPDLRSTQPVNLKLVPVRQLDLYSTPTKHPLILLQEKLVTLSPLLVMLGI